MKVVRNVGAEACTARRYTRALLDPATAVIDTISAQRNVTLQFRLDGSPVRVSMTRTRRDLVDLALSVYIADELQARDQEQDGWGRGFEFLVPVLDPPMWRGVAEQLRSNLRFLSGDQYAFSWPQRTALPTGRRHRRRLPTNFDAVCLFSGGIDSLLGAVQLLDAGQRVLLVGHQAEGATAAAQTELARVLRARFPDQVALLQCRIAQSHMHQPTYRLPEKVEDSHRPRSFLFLAVAAAIADIVGIPDVYIPENGLIALNIPLQASRLGTLSTRTAHPIFLRDLAQTLRDVGVLSGTIRNPFMHVSKTDMLRTAHADYHDALLRSISCSRPTRYQNLHVRHCGYCVPCIYRRGAMIRCGLDRAQDYAFDVFHQLPDLKPLKRDDFRALVGFAKRVTTASDAELQRMVLAHGPFSPSVAADIGPGPATDYRPWTDMLQRWSSEFLADMHTLCSDSTKAMLYLAAKAVKTA